MTPVFFLGYKEGGAKIEPYTIIIMANSCNQHFSLEGDITLGGHPSKY
jgi:hypothetical protein